MAIILPLRDLLLWGLVPFLRTRGYSALPVHFLGKAATFNLLYAFPLLLLGDGEGMVATLADVFGWAFAIWGIGLYWWAGVLYAWQVHKLLAGRRDDRVGGRRWLTSTSRARPPYDTADRVTMPLLHADDRAGARGGLRPRRRAPAPRAPEPPRARASRLDVAAAVIAAFGRAGGVAAVQNSRDGRVDESQPGDADQPDRRRARRGARRTQDRVGAPARRPSPSCRPRTTAWQPSRPRTRTELRRLRVRTGLRAGHRPGVRFRVDNPPASRPQRAVRDEDLALLVNGLWRPAPRRSRSTTSD